MLSAPTDRTSPPAAAWLSPIQRVRGQAEELKTTGSYPSPRSSGVTVWPSTRATKAAAPTTADQTSSSRANQRTSTVNSVHPPAELANELSASGNQPGPRR